MTTVAVVAHTRKQLGGGLTELREVLAAHGIDDPLWHEVSKSKQAPKQCRLALEAGADLVFVWGGDGMVQRCADVLAGTGAATAVVPAGTANLLATNLGIPRDVERAVRIGLGGHRRDLDVGRINGERFLVMAGVGFDVLMIRDADRDLKDRVGRAAYIWTGAHHIREDPVEMRVIVDGTTWFHGDADVRAGRQRRDDHRRHHRLRIGPPRRRSVGDRRRDRQRDAAVGTRSWPGWSPVAPTRPHSSR